MRSFPVHERSEQPFQLSEAARRLKARQEGDADPTLRGIAPLATAGAEELAPLMDRRYLSQLGSSGAGALLVSDELLELLPDDEGRPRIVVEDAHQAMAGLLEWLHPLRPLEPGIHPTVVLGHGIELGDEVVIGPYAVLEPGVRVGDGARIGAHSVIGAGARIGDGSFLYPHVVVYPGTVVGRKVILHAGVRVGVDGFGYVLVDGEHRKVPQVGRCVIEDGVEVGANSTFDRGSIGDTRVGTGTKVDNLVQLGHNVTVGPLSILVSQVGIAGSTTLGTGVVAAGQVGIGGHLHVGDQAVLAGQSGVTGDIPPNSTYMGFPARPRTEFLRMLAAQAKVTELVRRVRELERTVAALDGGTDDPAPGAKEPGANDEGKGATP